MSWVHAARGDRGILHDIPSLAGEVVRPQGVKEGAQSIRDKLTVDYVIEECEPTKDLQLACHCILRTGKKTHAEPYLKGRRAARFRDSVM